jgi:D-glycero-D-manno-heptose 1,7-bisphosphate phosphatase
MNVRKNSELSLCDLTAIIMAGGKGTRIASVDDTIPKPMLPICGRPILEHQIETLRNQGIEKVWFIVGHMGEVIERYFGDGSGESPITGKPFGVGISYYKEDKPLGTAGALFHISNDIGKDFFLVNGDLIFDVDVKRFLDFHAAHDSPATVFVHPNDHPFDSAIIDADGNGLVKKWIHKEDERDWYHNSVNAGLHILSSNLFYDSSRSGKIDMDRDVLKPLVGENRLYAYHSTEYVKDIGTPERLVEVSSDIESGLVHRKNLAVRQRAVFLDRDGTINRYVGFLRDIDEFELLPGVADAVRTLNRSGYLVIVVTNQPVIARGEVSWDELNDIHRKMETLLGEKGAYIDDIFVCPHHPDKGFAGERPEYKIECDCRKPRPGMLIEAAKKYNIDLAHSYMVGDSDSDIEAGEAAGCVTFKVGKENLLYFADNIFRGGGVND